MLDKLDAMRGPGESYTSSSCGWRGSRLACADLSDGVEGGLVARALLDLAEHGQVSDSHINAASSQLGFDPVTVRANLNVALTGHIAQATQHLANEGVDGAKIWEWAQRNQPAALKEAVIGHGRSGNVRAWDGLAGQYLNGLEKRDPQAAVALASARGFVAAIDPDSKNVLVDVPGVGRTTFSAALRAGFLNHKAHDRG
jgi:hypothetical protein